MLLHAPLHTVLRHRIIYRANQFIWQILLLHIMSGVIMSRICSLRHAPIPSRRCNGCPSGAAERYESEYCVHRSGRLVNPKIGGIAFRRTGNVCHRLRQGNPPLRHPDKIDRLHGRNRHLQSVRICVPTSSDAQITTRRAINFGSSPA